MTEKTQEANGQAWYIESPSSAEPLMDGAPKAGRSFYTSLGHLDSSKSPFSIDYQVEGS
jgi:hypothetical protein